MATPQLGKGGVREASSIAAATMIFVSLFKLMGWEPIKPKGKGENSEKSLGRIIPDFPASKLCQVLSNEPRQESKPIPVTTTSTNNEQ